MYKDKIVELDNGLEYLVLSEYDMDDRKYIMAAMVDSEKDLVDEDELMVKVIITQNGRDNIMDIDNPKELEEVTRVLLARASLEQEK